jgi:hypothetical protein
MKFCRRFLISSLTTRSNWNIWAESNDRHLGLILNFINYGFENSKDQRWFKMFLLNSNFEISTKEFWAHIAHRLSSQYKICVTALVT